MSKQNILSLTIVLFFFFPILTFAQVDKSRTTTVEFPDTEDEDLIEANPDDLKNRKIAATTEEVEAELEQKRNRKNLVKFNPVFDYARGYIPINYERMIIPHRLSIGFGLGPTFKDFLAMGDVASVFPNYADNENYFTNDEMKFRVGLTYDIEARYFYKNFFDVPSNYNGLFVGVGFNSRVMNYNYVPLEIYNINADYTDRTVINSFRLNTGYCAEIPYLYGINFYYELNAGVGSRSYNTNINNRIIEFDGSFNPIVIDNLETFSFNKIAFIFNIKLGVIF